jgi:hypothetical protein
MYIYIYIYTHLDYKPNILILIPPSEVQQTKSLKSSIFIVQVSHGKLFSPSNSVESIQF